MPEMTDCKTDPQLVSDEKMKVLENEVTATKTKVEKDHEQRFKDIEAENAVIKQKLNEVIVWLQQLQTTQEKK